MVVRAAGDEADTLAREFLRHGLGVEHDLVLIRLEAVGQRLLEADRLARDDVLQRAALRAREDGLVDGLRVLLATENHAAARAAQRLVRGGGHEVGIRHWGRMLARGDQTGDVRHIDHQQASGLVSDVAQSGEVDDAGIGGGARDDQLRPDLKRLALECVIVDDLLVLRDAVRHEVEVLAGHVDRAAVRQMAAVREVHAHHRVAGVEHREVDSHVRLRTGVRLHVGMLRAEQLLRAIAGQVFHDVDVLAAAVIALARIALRVFIGQVGAHRRKHRVADKVFGRDQLDMLALTGQLIVHRCAQLGIDRLDGFEINHAFAPPF